LKDKLRVEEETLLKSPEHCNNDEFNKDWNNCYSLLRSETSTNKRQLVTINAENKKVSMEIDTGAVVTVCSDISYKTYFGNLKLENVKMPLNGASGDSLDIKGQVQVNVKFENQKYKLSIVVIKSDRPLLLIGRNWLDILFPSWREAFKINVINSSCKEFLEKVKKKYKNVFKTNISEPINKIKVDIKLNESARPIVYKPYNVPFSLKEKVEKELDRLESENIIEKIKASEWASPIVVVPKPNTYLLYFCCKHLSMHMLFV
jgi:Retroviral aspartyl protease